MRIHILSLLSLATAFQPQQPQKPPAAVALPKAPAAFVAAAFSAAVLFSPLPSEASSTAAQISINSIPPTSINIDIPDLPVIGNLLSGTYTKTDKVSKAPSVVIKSPADKVGAIREAATGGHLEFDVKGKLKTHLDIDVATDETGVARVRVASDLIPPLPFNNLASSSQKTGGRESAWNIVTNMGNGESYYYNAKTGVTQFERPAKF